MDASTTLLYWSAPHYPAVSVKKPIVSWQSVLTSPRPPRLPPAPLQLGKYDAKGESAEAAKGMYEKGYTY